jgi:RNA 3'-terminal phosphate cyclase-like protein
MLDPPQEILVGFTPNVYIYTDNYSKKEAGLYVSSSPHSREWLTCATTYLWLNCARRSPGYAVTLVAESDTGCVLSAEYCAKPQQLPEDVGKQAAHLLLQEVLQVLPGTCATESVEALIRHALSCCCCLCREAA